MMRLDPDQALDVIADAWTDWATHRIGEAELGGRVADALEAAGRELVRLVEPDERHEHP